MRNKFFVGSILLALVLFLLLVVLALTGLDRYTQPSQPEVVGAFPLHERWHIHLEGSDLVGPVVGEDTIFVCLTPYVYAIRARDGHILWQQNLHRRLGTLSTLVAHDGLVCVGVGDGTVIVLEAETGQILWQDQREGSVDAVTIGPGEIYVGRCNKQVIAYDRATGNALWEVPHRIRGGAPQVFVDRNMVYVLDLEAIYARDTRTGTIHWQKNTPRIVRAIFVDGVIYGFSGEATCSAFDVRTRGWIWRVPDVEVAHKQATPVFSAGRLYTGSYHGGDVYAIDTTQGRILWKTNIPSQFLSLSVGIGTPRVLAGVVYARMDSAGYILALSAETGEVLGRLHTHHNWFRIQPYPIAVADGLLIVPFGDNDLYAYGP